MELNDNIEKLKSIGTKRASKLHKLNIYTVSDIIEYFPRDYINRSNLLSIKDFTIDKENTFIASIATIYENKRINDKIITSILLKDLTGTITAVWYNQPYLKNNFLKGYEYLFTGKVIKKYNKLEIISPEYESINNGELLSGGRIVPIYASTYKLSQKMLRQLIKNVIDNIYNLCEEFIPEYIIKKYKLLDRKSAIQNIHFPIDEENFFKARYRLVFEEFFLLQLGLKHIKMLTAQNKNALVIKKIDKEQELINSLPFHLTNAQYKALEEIKQNLSNGNIMNRLIQGDVGSGKTIIALIIAFIVAENGYQTAMMVPTEVLAKQHYENFNKYLSYTGIKILLLTGSTTKKQKNIIIEQIQNNTAQIVIGTHALIEENIIFKNLGLVITDEQHRFGVHQRAKLSTKGINPHTLVMTATPIPRTLALILYGDLDITIIDELPPNRQKIDTFAVDSSYYNRIYKFIKKELEERRQIYIICPMVEEDEKYQDLKSVKEYTQKLKENIFLDYSIEYIHGKMKSKEKQDIMDNFINGNINILVATTVIEVGIDVPNATMIVIENAERFGLAQLHQLRGRVGRGSYKSYCILITDSKSKLTTERMKIMTKSNDGFELSAVDLQLRGTGDFFGTRQHGLPELKIANLYKDMEILRVVQKLANEVLEEDFELINKENLSLKKKLINFFESEEKVYSL